MRVTLTERDLVDFEREVARRFEAKEIQAPVHLSGGNERQLIEVFERHVGPDDWVCCTWRAHFHALLKGVPRDEVMAAVLKGHSIALGFPEYRVISSAIVGGMAPIAVGLAMGIKRKREQHLRRVVCFVGDMGAATGVVQESMMYSHYHELPLTFVIEDNEVSCSTPTRTVWGGDIVDWPNAIRYRYTNQWPHCGVGKLVSF